MLEHVPVASFVYRLWQTEKCALSLLYTECKHFQSSKWVKLAGDTGGIVCKAEGISIGKLGNLAMSTMHCSNIPQLC